MNLSSLPATYSVRYRAVKTLDCLFVAIAALDLYRSVALFPVTIVPAPEGYAIFYSGFNTILVVAAIAFVIVFPVYWRRREHAAMDDRSGKITFNSGLYHAWLTGIIRYWITAEVFTYAFARLMGTQFAHVYSRDDMTMGDLSGVDITRYYFGYSRILSGIIGWVQIAGSALLLFRRTMLPAVIILLPFMLRLVLIGIFFSIPPNTLINVILLSGGLLYLLSLHWPQIRTFFTLPVPTLPKVRPLSFRNLARALVAIYAFALVFYVRTTRSPDMLVGKWKVAQMTRNGDTVKVNAWLTDSTSWKNVYLEKFGSFTFSPNPYVVDRDRSLTGTYIYDSGKEEIKFLAHATNGLNDTLYARVSFHTNGQMHWNMTTGDVMLSILLSRADDPSAPGP